MTALDKDLDILLTAVMASLSATGHPNYMHSDFDAAMEAWGRVRERFGELERSLRETSRKYTLLEEELRLTRAQLAALQDDVPADPDTGGYEPGDPKAWAIREERA